MAWEGFLGGDRDVGRMGQEGCLLTNRCNLWAEPKKDPSNNAYKQEAPPSIAREVQARAVQAFRGLLGRGKSWIRLPRSRDQAGASDAHGSLGAS